MCVSIYIHIACRQTLRTFMIHCPYAFVGIEMTMRRPLRWHMPPLFQCAPPLWYTSDRPSRWGRHTRARPWPCHRACQILIFSYHKRPCKLNLFIGGPELATPCHAARVSPSCLELILYRFGLPAYRHSWNTCSRTPRWYIHLPEREPCMARQRQRYPLQVWNRIKILIHAFLPLPRRRKPM